jgi:hypothetical protein
VAQDGVFLEIVLRTLWTPQLHTDNVIRLPYTLATYLSAMIKSMIQDVDKKSDENRYCPSNFLIQGVKSRNYVPVMKRQLCESLENRIKHSMKKRKRKGNI